MFERLTILCLCGALLLGCGNSTAIEAGQGNEGSSIDAEDDTGQTSELATTTVPDEQNGEVPTVGDGSPEANSTSTVPYDDDSDIVLPRPELDISAEFYENLNKPETPITSLCWAMREVSLQHLLIVALDDDEATRNAEASAAELLAFLRLGGDEGEKAYLAYAEAAETSGCAQLI